MKSAGILLPVFSLPSKYGIGSFSVEAYNFIDFLEKAGQKYWQILPLVPAGSCNSPYQSCSTFAGNPLFIDLQQLIDLELLSEEEVESCDWGSNNERVDYTKVYENKKRLLYTAYTQCDKIDIKNYTIFYNKNKFWLKGYCEYMSKNEGKDEDYYKFEQYEFYSQWRLLKSYANSKGVSIIGDLPIYVSLDSSDVQDNPELFQLDADGKPKAVAGCPPDDFCADGQMWGNPLYNWEKHKETNYDWWIKRIQHCFNLYDVVRIDHFRAIHDYFSIPYGDKTAKNGHWELGPGMELFTAIKRKLGNVKLIAEDLGLLSPGVIDLLHETGFPGMKILQFAFGYDKNNPYLPKNISENYIVYTGTHDNNTTIGWYNNANDKEKEIVKYFINGDEINWGLIELAMSTRANMCIIPMQDYLGLDEKHRTNIPGSTFGNWEWRMKEIPNEYLAYRIKSLTEQYKR